MAKAILLPLKIGQENDEASESLTYSIALADSQYKVVKAIAAIRFQEIPEFIKDAILTRCQADAAGLRCTEGSVC